jgi:GGDEF domain-containing protein
MKIEVPDEIIELLKKEMNWLFFDKTVSEALQELIKDRFYKESIKGFEVDPLTGAKHLFAFIKKINTQKIKKNQMFYIFNVRGLKCYNDINGFPLGDKYLIETTKYLLHTIDAEVYRIGGDRFFSEVNLNNSIVNKLITKFEIVKMKSLIDINEYFKTYLHGETIIDLILNASIGNTNHFFKVLKRFKS